MGAIAPAGGGPVSALGEGWGELAGEVVADVLAFEDDEVDGAVLGFIETDQRPAFSIDDEFAAADAFEAGEGFGEKGWAGEFLLVEELEEFAGVFMPIVEHEEGRLIGVDEAGLDDFDLEGCGVCDDGAGGGTGEDEREGDACGGGERDGEAAEPGGFALGGAAAFHGGEDRSAEAIRDAEGGDGADHGGIEGVLGLGDVAALGGKGLADVFEKVLGQGDGGEGDGEVGIEGALLGEPVSEVAVFGGEAEGFGEVGVFGVRAIGAEAVEEKFGLVFIHGVVRGPPVRVEGCSWGRWRARRSFGGGGFPCRGRGVT